MKCKKCGIEISEEDVFCSKCGEKIENKVEQDKTEEINTVEEIKGNNGLTDKKKNIKYGLAVCVVVVVILAGAGIYRATAHSNSSIESTQVSEKAKTDSTKVADNTEEIKKSADNKKPKDGTMDENGCIWFSSEESDYEIDSSTGKILKYNGTAEYISVPKTINGVQVLEIGESAFEGCKCKNISLNSAIGLVNIKSKAFANSKDLTTVSIQDSVQTIGDGAFANCTNLSAINIPSGLKSLGASAFIECKALKRIDINAPILIVQDNTFKGCSGLEFVFLKGKINEIGANAFSSSGIKVMGLPEALGVIGDNAFENCKSLSEVTVSGSLIRIGKYAFRGCTNLQNIYASKSDSNMIIDSMKSK